MQLPRTTSQPLVREGHAEAQAAHPKWRTPSTATEVELENIAERASPLINPGTVVRLHQATGNEVASSLSHDNAYSFETEPVLRHIQGDSLHETDQMPSGNYEMDLQHRAPAFRPPASRTSLVWAASQQHGTPPEHGASPSTDAVEAAHHFISRLPGAEVKEARYGMDSLTAPSTHSAQAAAGEECYPASRHPDADGPDQLHAAVRRENGLGPLPDDLQGDAADVHGVPESHPYTSNIVSNARMLHTSDPPHQVELFSQNAAAVGVHEVLDRRTLENG